MWTVPAPVALDQHAEPAKEIGVAQKAADRAAAADLSEAQSARGDSRPDKSVGEGT